MGAASRDDFERALDHLRAAGRLMGDPPCIIACCELISERQRQIEAEGFAPERDDQYTDNELARAAAAYALVSAKDYPHWALFHHGFTRPIWPESWAQSWLTKPHSKRRALVIAGALVLAELERLERADVAARDLRQGQGRGRG